jgi:hypothetical protein
MLYFWRTFVGLWRNNVGLWRTFVCLWRNNVGLWRSQTPFEPSLNIKHYQAVFAQGAVALPFQVDVLGVAVADARGYGVLCQCDGISFKYKGGRTGLFIKFHHQDSPFLVGKLCLYNSAISAAGNQYANGAQKQGSLKIPRHFYYKNFHMAVY